LTSRCLQATWGAFTGRFLQKTARGDAALFEVLAHELGYEIDTGRLRADSIAVAETPVRIAQAILPHLSGRTSLADLVARLNDDAANAPLAPVPNLPACLSDLTSRGLRLAVATNDAETPARAHLEAAGILPFFDMVLGYDSGHGGKPAPGQLLAVCDVFDIPGNRLVMVGDSLHDLMAGRAVTARTGGVLSGTATAADLAPLADVVLPDVGELPSWLDGLAT